MQPNIFRSSMHNGLILGVLLSLKFLFSTPNNSVLSFVALLISILIVFALYKLAIRFRENECGGIIKYGQAFKYIFQVYFFGTIIASLVILIYTRFFNPGYLEFTLNSLLKMYDNFKFPIDDTTHKLMETLYKPAPYALLNIFSSMFVGAFWGLILASFVKKEKSIFEK